MRFRLLRLVPTHAGLARVDIPNRLGSDTTILCGPSRTHVLANARELGLLGRLEAVELDEDDRPVREAVRA